jgi:transposase-like protein
LPRKANDDCLIELRWLYDRRNVEEARRDLTAGLAKWAKQLSQTMRLGRREYRGNAQLLPLAAAASQEPEIGQQCWKRIMEEIKRRTLVVASSPTLPVSTVLSRGRSLKRRPHPLLPETSCRTNRALKS